MTTLPTLSSPISPSSFPSQLSPTANNQPPKNKSPSSQHKSYFFKFCGHSICVLIYQSFFFCTQFPSIKLSVIFFLPTALATECGVTDERYADGSFPSAI